MSFAARLFLLLCFCATSLLACDAHRHYMAVAPGMTQDEVRETFQGRPTAFLDHGQGYVTWKYGDDYCVLFKDNAVVSKNIRKESAQGEQDANNKGTPSRRPAHCPLPHLPPAPES